MTKNISISKVLIAIAIFALAGFSVATVVRAEGEAEFATETAVASEPIAPVAPNENIVVTVDTDMVMPEVLTHGGEVPDTTAPVSPDAPITPTTPVPSTEMTPVVVADEQIDTTPVTPTTPTPAPRERNSRSGGSRNASVGRVLGASDFQFTTDLGFGMNVNDVVELQERLRAEGYFTFATSTGYFGSITLDAVKAYQTAHGIIATGFVGPLTRASLNGAAQMSAAPRNETELAIQSLKAQLVTLMTKLLTSYQAQMALQSTSTATTTAPTATSTASSTRS